MPEPLIDRAFAEKFLVSVDRPLDYGVYFLFHEWWAEAPQSAIDAYAKELASLPGAPEFLAARHLPEPLSIDRLAKCEPGTLGAAYHAFIVDNDLLVDLARDYRAFNEQLSAAGKLDRLPDDLSYAIVRGFQIHDFLHVLTGFDSTPFGELAQAAFHFAQLRYPYHAMRMAVTTAHMAFVQPGITVQAMDAIVDGWSLGRSWRNLHFARWEDEIDTPLETLRREWMLQPRQAA
jgi:ubiquinone biosynthesis protein Coq4